MNAEMSVHTMDDRSIPNVPHQLPAIWRDTESLGFTMTSDPQTGSLLRTLAATKPGGRVLELGTGTGVGTTWLLAGMDADARMDSVESDETVLNVARRHLGHDARVAFHHVDGAEFLENATGTRYDLIYADTWAGKYTHLDLALSLLGEGGIYVIDDLLPQPNWPEGHAAKVPALIAELQARTDLVTTTLAWASGLMLVSRRG